MDLGDGDKLGNDGARVKHHCRLDRCAGEALIEAEYSRCTQTSFIALGRCGSPTFSGRLHVCELHRSISPDVPRMGHRPRRGVPDIDGGSTMIGVFRPRSDARESRPIEKRFD